MPEYTTIDGDGAREAVRSTLIDRRGIPLWVPRGTILLRGTHKGMHLQQQGLITLQGKGERRRVRGERVIANGHVTNLSLFPLPSSLFALRSSAAWGLVRVAQQDERGPIVRMRGPFAAAEN